MSFTQVVFTGSVRGVADETPTGTVTIALPATMADAAGNQIRAGTWTYPLVNGGWSKTVAANDDATTTPAGCYYLVTVAIDGAPPMEPVAVQIPANAPGGTIDFAELAPVVLEPVTDYATVAELFDQFTVLDGGAPSSTYSAPAHIDGGTP